EKSIGPPILGCQEPTGQRNWRSLPLRVRIHTPGELLVRLVAIRHREGDARAVRAVLEERAARIRLVLRSAVLTNEAAEVAEALAAAEGPEGLLAEVERDRGV